MKEEGKKKKLTTAELLENLWNPLDTIGQAVMGSLWRDVYETFQDAIALCLLFSIPGWIGKLILGAELLTLLISFLILIILIKMNLN